MPSKTKPSPESESGHGFRPSDFRAYAKRVSGFAVSGHAASHKVRDRAFIVAAALIDLAEAQEAE